MTQTAQIATGLARLSTVFRAGVRQQADALGLSPIQADLLDFLAARGALRQSSLAAELAVTQPTVSDALAALKRKGLVRSLPDPRDGRAQILQLTAEGAALALDLSGGPQLIVAAIAALPEEQAAALLGGMIGMIRNLQQSGAIAPQRMCHRCTHFRPNIHDDAARPHHCAFVNAAFGDGHLRIDCAEFDEAGGAPMR